MPGSFHRRARPGVAYVLLVAASLAGCTMIADNIMNPDDPGLDLPRDKTAAEQAARERDSDQKEPQRKSQ
jgi:hypothetical protein